LLKQILATKVSLVSKDVVCRSEIGPKHFDKLKPEPGPTYNSGIYRTTINYSFLNFWEGTAPECNP